MSRHRMPMASASASTWATLAMRRSAALSSKSDSAKLRIDTPEDRTLLAKA